VDVLCELIYMTGIKGGGIARYQMVVNAIVPRVLALRPSWNESVKQEETDIARGKYSYYL
jgi:hypothetical protein